MLNVVLVEPQIPSNTGNIGRTCVITGTRLHLVGPIGFDLSEHALKRAGMAYWESLDVRVYDDWDAFVEANGLSERLAEGETAGATGGRVHLLTKRGATVYCEAAYHDGDWLVFGNEATGLPRELLDAYPHCCERIPMLSDQSALLNADEWRERHERDRLGLGREQTEQAQAEHAKPELRRDVSGNFVDDRSSQITSLNLSNAAAIVLYEALRQTGFAGME